MSEDTILIDEVADGAAIVRDLFRRRFHDDPPAQPHHVIAFHCDERDQRTPICYIHFRDFHEALLGGGACIDARALRRVSEVLRDDIRARGGLYRMTLDWAVGHFRDRYAAIFGYCGDALAERADLAAGFSRTSHPHLLVQWTRDVADDEHERLVASAQALGPF